MVLIQILWSSFVVIIWANVKAVLLILADTVCQTHILEENAAFVQKKKTADTFTLTFAAKNTFITHE